jgi:Fe-S cluster biosynthesis and repair protein YggX
MKRMIHCRKLNKETEGFTQPPIPGDLGQRIYEEISMEAWQMWLAHQTMLINEYRLSMIDPKARGFLLAEMQSFFFGEGSDKPSGYTPEK